MTGASDNLRSHRQTRIVSFACALLVAGSLSMGSASGASRKALIDGDTVSGSPSQEEAIATTQGYAVTVVDDATWGSYTAADFGQYDLLIAGDPTCGELPPGLVSTASAYGSVVLGSAGGRTTVGNRIVVGTDPVFHDGGDYTSPGARGTIIREGIGYAGSQLGATGMYFDASCGAPDFGQSAETLAIVDALSLGSGVWTIDAAPPCGGSVSLIASNPSFTDLTTASLEGWGCSVHESFPTFRSDWSALAVATDTTSHPTCGVDPGTGASACGEAYLLVAGSSIVVHSKVISVTPLEATNPVGTNHTVTANVHDASGAPPVEGQLVDFSVTGQNEGAPGTCAPADCKSDVKGDVAFTYFDAAGTGDDTIKASFTDTEGSLQTATAQKHWGSGGTTTPTCGLTAITNGPPSQVQLSLRDTGSGLASAKIRKHVNATASLDAFAPGTTSPVNAIFTKVEETKGAFGSVGATNVDGTSVRCGAFFKTVEPRKVFTQGFLGGKRKDVLEIQNTTPGLKGATIVVNGTITKVGLTPGEDYLLPLGPMLHAGKKNSITVTGRGKHHHSAVAVLWGPGMTPV